MGKKSRTKGRAFEQEIARDLRAIWPDVKRGLQFRGEKVDGADLSADDMPFGVECKRYASVTQGMIENWLKGMYWRDVLIYRADRERARVAYHESVFWPTVLSSPKNMAEDKGGVVKCFTVDDAVHIDCDYTYWLEVVGRVRGDDTEVEVV